MSDSSVVCSSRCLSENNSFLFFEFLRFRSDTVKATVRVEYDPASLGASKASIPLPRLSVSFCEPSCSVASRHVGGTGGKLHGRIVTWCVVYNKIAFFFFSSLDLLCNVHM